MNLFFYKTYFPKNRIRLRIDTEAERVLIIYFSIQLLRTTLHAKYI